MIPRPKALAASLAAVLCSVLLLGAQPVAAADQTVNLPYISARQGRQPVDGALLRLPPAAGEHARLLAGRRADRSTALADDRPRQPAAGARSTARPASWSWRTCRSASSPSPAASSSTRTKATSASSTSSRTRRTATRPSSSRSTPTPTTASKAARPSPTPRRRARTMPGSRQTSANNRAIVEIFNGMGAKTPFSVDYQPGNSQVVGNLSTSIPAGKEIAIMHVHAVANNAADGQDLVKKFKESKALKDVPPNIRKLIVNFNAARPRSTATTRSSAATCSTSSRCAPATSSAATSRRPSYKIATFYGTVTVPAEKVISVISIGAVRPRQLLFTTDGDVIGGTLEHDKIAPRTLRWADDGRPPRPGRHASATASSPASRTTPSRQALRPDAHRRAHRDPDAQGPDHRPHPLWPDEALARHADAIIFQNDEHADPRGPHERRHRASPPWSTASCSRPSSRPATRRSSSRSPAPPRLQFRPRPPTSTTTPPSSA